MLKFIIFSITFLIRTINNSKLDIKKKIKNVFKENFDRELSEHEINEIYSSMLETTERVLRAVPGFNENSLDKYLGGNLEITFSPLAIENEVQRVIQEIGMEALESSTKYKRMYELTNAMCIMLALKKLNGEEWLVKSQDFPDTILIKPNHENVESQPFDAVNLEIMQIPSIVFNELSEPYEEQIAKFIASKKFNKRYGEFPHLLVHLNFTGTRPIVLGKISEEISKLPGNPFHQIWVRMNASPTFQKQNVSRIYPTFLPVDFDVVKERNLYF